MTSVTNKATITELRRIATLNRGVLLAEEVVKHARKKSSPIHKHFNWDDSEAAELWRIRQARELIRVAVEYIGESKQPIRVFVSLKPDREKNGGGYRSMVTVMNDDQMREQFLSDALEDMEIFRDKYKSLKELAEVFAAMQRTEIRLTRKSA